MRNYSFILSSNYSKSHTMFKSDYVKNGIKDILALKTGMEKMKKDENQTHQLIHQNFSCSSFDILLGNGKHLHAGNIKFQNLICLHKASELIA